MAQKIFSSTDYFNFDGREVPLPPVPTLHQILESANAIRPHGNLVPVDAEDLDIISEHYLPAAEPVTLLHEVKRLLETLPPDEKEAINEWMMDETGKEPPEAIAKLRRLVSPPPATTYH